MERCVFYRKIAAIRIFKIEMSKTLIIQGLDFLSKQLSSLGLCENVQPLTAAIADITRSKPNKPWTYRIDDLPIFVNKSPRNAYPALDSMIIFLNISITEIDSNKDENNISNLIESSDFSILIKGKKKNENNHFYASWHLDNDSRGEDYVHPQFHIAFGVSKLEEKINSNFGNVLLLTSPRLPHPPLDGILAIDFVLRHFVTVDIHKQLTESNSYKMYIRNSQRRLWRPYYTSISKFWCPNCHLVVENEKENVKYVPQLI